MRVLFADTPRPDPPINSRDFLKFQGNSLRTQLIVTDEIERLGITELLKSRGSRILKFDGLSDGDSKFDGSAIDPEADVLVISGDLTPMPFGGLSRTLETVAAVTPETRVLIISDIRSIPATSLAISQHLKVPSDIVLRRETVSSDDLLRSIRRLALGQPGRLDTVAPYIEENRLLEASASIPKLTARELEILAQVAQGVSNRQIASGLKLSLRTVNNHVRMIFLKLGINSDSDINARVTAALAFCIFSRVLTSAPTMIALPKASESVIVSDDFRAVSSSTEYDT